MSRQTENARQARADEKTDALAAEVLAVKDAAAAELAAALHEVDSLVQDHDNDVQALVRAAIDGLSPDPDALMRVRRLLLLVANSSFELMNCINGKAEDAGRSYVDRAEQAFSDRVCAERRRIMAAKAGAA